VLPRLSAAANKPLWLAAAAQQPPQAEQQQQQQASDARMFSNLNRDLKHDPGSVLGSAMLVAGTTIGAGEQQQQQRNSMWHCCLCSGLSITCLNCQHNWQQHSTAIDVFNVVLKTQQQYNSAPKILVLASVIFSPVIVLLPAGILVGALAGACVVLFFTDASTVQQCSGGWLACSCLHALHMKQQSSLHTCLRQH
jgi:hypothetical protein